MSSPPSQTKLEQQLLDAYGLLLSTKQLASFLGRTPAGLRWTLSHPSDPRTFALRNCLRRVGGRFYIASSDVAEIVVGGERP